MGRYWRLPVGANTGLNAGENPEDQPLDLTRRQANELDYHREHARENASLVERPLSMDVLDRPSRRWWNAYWRMYSRLIDLGVHNKRVLVVGCGFGEDAIRLARLGAEVHAFDLSPESLAIATGRAERAGVEVAFQEMPAERLLYRDGLFDCVLARDILHHVDIPSAMREIRRVSKPGGVFLANEIYSHSFTEGIRRARFVETRIYPRLQRVIYGDDKPYITADERKLTQVDLRHIKSALASLDFEEYFYFLVNRILPERWSTASKLDRKLLMAAPGIGPLIAGRVILSGRLGK